MQNTNILDTACLIQLQTGTWQANKMLSANEIGEFADPEWVCGKKHLVGPEFLAGPRIVINRARKYLKNITLPFPITSLALVPRDSIEKVDSRLLTVKAEFFREVEKICREYPEAYRLAEENLSKHGLFSEQDYPRDVYRLYRFDWRFLDIRVPGQLKSISPEIYRREMAQFEVLMNEAKEVAIAALFEELSELVERMVDRLGEGEDGKPKKFKDSLVKNFTEFFDNFNERNVFQNEKLEDIVARAKGVLTGVTPEGLRRFSDIRAKIAGEMSGVKRIIDEATVDLPRRKIKFDPVEKAVDQAA